MSIMNKIESGMEKILVPIATKLNAQRHICAIRDAFILAFPITMAGSLMVLLNNVLLDPNGFVAKLIHLGDLIPNLADYQAIFAPILNGSLNILAILIVFLIARNLARILGADDLLVGLAAVSVFFIIYPAGEGGMISTQYMGPQGLFVAIIVGLVVGEILSRLSKTPKLEIKMPEQVPPAVARTFKILFPIIIVVMGFSIGNFLLLKVTDGGGIHTLIYNFLQAPLTKIGDSIFSVIIFAIVSNLLWIMGIHGPNTIAAVRDTMFSEANQANLAFVQANGTAWGAPYETTWALTDAFSNYGGSGMTLGLIIAIFLFSKMKDQRDIAKLSLAPGLFNINESIIFGLPIVLNPILIIPFLIIPIVNILIGYSFILLKIIPPVAYPVLWTTPGPLIPFIGTGGEIMGLVVGIICLAVSVLIYAPFIIASNKANKQMYEEELNSNTESM
ncbi:PTS sugar transporter subunit IIC [Clostridium sartagoforme]|uniref:Permease IIC component n=1 Tax=Clostridium sartagoforme TaxID=84031 RepID=A0A4S2DK79_9CLOT|nr:PTS transporter subunit EIIC [Clostridium sartagoforme]TGY42637.1 PTS sugar transporter subunit IIC [Clostridium sartagoforme]